MGYEIHTLAQVFLRRRRAQSAATGANLDVRKKMELCLKGALGVPPRCLGAAFEVP